jgi:hypothetical protein
MHATRVLFGIVPARPAILYSAAEPLACKPYQSQLEVDRAGGERLGVEQCRCRVGGQVAGHVDSIQANGQHRRRYQCAKMHLQVDECYRVEGCVKLGLQFSARKTDHMQTYRVMIGSAASPSQSRPELAPSIALEKESVVLVNGTAYCKDVTVHHFTVNSIDRVRTF